MLKQLLVLCLLPLPAFSQVVIESSEVVVNTTTGLEDSLTDSAIVLPAGTDALLVCAGTGGNLTNPAATWNTSETLTQVGITTLSGNGADAGVAAFCLLSPTVTTADLVFTFDSIHNAIWMTTHALSDVDQTSCAASMTELDEDVDDAAASTTAVFSELGASGNLGFICTNMVSSNATASNDAAWAEIFESNTGGGAGGSTEDFSFNVISGDLPEAVTVTISETDEHAALYMSVAAAAGAAPSAAVLRRRRM
jgi:hypothetical protein